MKTYLILAIMIALLVIVALGGVSGCMRYQQEVTELKAERNLLRTRADSLSNRAAQDCDEKIAQARKQLSYENPPSPAPVKPSILR